jgi:hypothetical protein
MSYLLGLAGTQTTCITDKYNVFGIEVNMCCMKGTAEFFFE